MKLYREQRRRFVERALAAGWHRDRINYSLCLWTFLGGIDACTKKLIKEEYYRVLGNAYSQYAKKMVEMLRKPLPIFKYLKNRKGSAMDQRPLWPNIIVRRR